MTVIDTHIWIWLNSAPERIARAALEHLGHETDIGLSPVSIYETMLALDKGRIVSHLTPERLVRRWLRPGVVSIIPLQEDMTIASRTLPFQHQDPFDRIIAATAVHLKAPLMTADRDLLNLKWLQTIPAC
jgi:PIN domain nuclease of toxin-antitoxin system